MELPHFKTALTGVFLTINVTWCHYLWRVGDDLGEGHSCTNKETPVVRELTKRQENCKGKSNAIVIPHLWGCIYKVVGFFLLLINFGVLNSI